MVVPRALHGPPDGSGDDGSHPRQAPLRERRGLLAGIGACGIGAVLLAIWQAPAWAAVTLSILAIVLVASVVMLLFGDRETPLERLLKIIKALR